MLKNWIDAGQLPAVRIGRRVRVLGSDFERLVRSDYHGAGVERRSVWSRWRRST
ncbi:MAG: helix-turn-helix domain-containing protein [Solirubrobacteraceae bacterium]